jgi:hypothetical protein
LTTDGLTLSTISGIISFTSGRTVAAQEKLLKVKNTNIDNKNP